MADQTLSQPLDPTGQSLDSLAKLSARTEAFYQKGLEGAPNTIRAYRSDIKQFQSWCLSYGLPHLPASVQTLALFVTHLAEAGKKVATLERKVAAISTLHQVHNQESPSGHPSFKRVMEGIKREKGVAQRQAPAFELEEFKRVIRLLDVSTLRSLRDKVVLLLGFTGAFRRSELSAVNVEHLSFDKDCLLIEIPRSKTNQLGKKKHKAIFFSPDPDLCPVRTTQEYVQKMKLATGPLLVSFRKGDRPSEKRLSDQSINDISQLYLGRDFTAHSLRASFVSVAKLHGADDQEVMVQGDWKTTSMIIRYNRINDVKRYNAAKKLGL